MRILPELLSPAGGLEKMRYAFAFGADAVYAGLPRYSLRTRNNTFRLAELTTGIAEAHALSKRFYVTCNLTPHNAKLKTFIADIDPVVALGPDALIMADPGLIMLAREKWPTLPIHLSVQANTVNYASVRFWQSAGVRRVILSREISLDEIAEIRDHCPDMELEVFVHGALCIAYSGRCLLSGYFNHRDANQGTCTNACRWNYQVHQAKGNIISSIADTAHNDQSHHPQATQEFLLEEGKRPDERMPIIEDEHGTYILNSKDLRAIEHIGRLLAIGVDSLKIEGRTKSAYYVARVTQAYRRAINDAAAGHDFDPALLIELDGLAHRGYTDGFYQRHHSAAQNYTSGQSENRERLYVGNIIAHDTATGMAEIQVKNRIQTGDMLEILHPSGNHLVRLERMENIDGQPLQEAPGGGWHIKIPLPGDLRGGMLARCLTTVDDDIMII